MHVGSFPSIWRLVVFGVLVGLGLLPIACGPSNARAYPVRGEVFYQGKPAEGALVHLHPRDKEKGGSPAFSTVQADGTFQLSTYGVNDGVVAGDFIVTITWRDERKTADGETFIGPDKLQDRYSRRDTSSLTATVHAGANELLRFDLK